MRRWRLAAGVGLLLAFTALHAVAPTAAVALPLPQLFTPASASTGAPPHDTAVLRAEAITVSLGALPAPGAATKDLALRLPGGRIVTASLTGSGPTVASDGTWTGVIRGIDGSNVTLAAKDGVVSGSFWLDGELYRLESLAGGEWLEQLDPHAFPAEGDPLDPGTDAPTAPSDDPPTAGDGASIIDVLVVYTATARAAAGGTAAIQSTIAVGVSQSNQTYANSLISQRIRLVYTGEVDYTESGNSTTDLTRFRDPADSFLDSVGPLRDQYGADLVVLVTESLDECGRAYSMTRPASSFASSAYSVVKRTCITGQYSFTHEMGHNMGAGHDRANSCSGSYTYSCGYQDTGGRFRTIMAYDCTDTCPRILYFSNPDVRYQTRPTGIADTLPTAANNAKTLNNTAAIVAAFRPSVNGVALAFADTPATALPGVPFAIQVAVRNSAGATVVADQTTVIAISPVVGPAAITCDTGLSRAAVRGIATFSGCRVSANGIYQLQATADLPLTPGTSAAIVAGGYRTPLPFVAADSGVG
jgi:hypothetical protein